MSIVIIIIIIIIIIIMIKKIYNTKKNNDKIIIIVMTIIIIVNVQFRKKWNSEKMDFRNVLLSRTSDTGNGNHSVSQPMILEQNHFAVSLYFTIFLFQ